jgi:hypothetical protein
MRLISWTLQSGSERLQYAIQHLKSDAILTNFCKHFNITKVK